MKFLSVWIVTVSVMATAAWGHFVWIELDPEKPTQATLRFAEEPLEDTPANLQEKALPMNVLAANDPIVFQKGEGASTAAIAPDTTVVAGTLTYGILDKRDAGRGLFRLMYYAKAARTAADASEIAGLAVEATAKVADETLEVTILNGGSPVEGAELVVVVPQELEPVEATTNAEGKALIPLTKEGWVGIRAMVADDTAGELDGKPYDLTRHYTTLTFKYTK